MQKLVAAIEEAYKAENGLMTTKEGLEKAIDILKRTIILIIQTMRCTGHKSSMIITKI